MRPVVNLFLKCDTYGQGFATQVNSQPRVAQLCTGSPACMSSS